MKVNGIWFNKLTDKWKYIFCTAVGGNENDTNFFDKISNLTYLDLRYNKITDISPLANLSNLIRLYLDSNRITDISPLANLVNCYISK